MQASISIPEYNVSYLPCETAYDPQVSPYLDTVLTAKPLQFPRGKQGKNRKTLPRRALDILCSFDIETTKIVIDGREHAVPYLWQLQIGLGSPVLIGRNFADVRDILESMSTRIKLGQKLIIYVHNLSYEFQFLTGLYNFTPSEVFAPKSRKVLKCSMFEGSIEFRCSWYLTNMSLAEACKQLDTPHKKLPDYDYDAARYPWTPLSDFEIAYSITDCYCVTEIVNALLTQNDDTLMTIPSTNTGYVRRDCKTNIATYKEYLKISHLKPSYPCFKRLAEAFRGGDTHANWLYTGDILTNIKSADRSSSYPDTHANDLFPMTPLVPDPDHTLKHLHHLINHNHACLFEITFKTLTQKPETHFSYIPESKSRNIKKPLTDNGRIVSADELTITITDLDYRIICNEYDFKAVCITDLYTAKYAKAPKALIELNLEYYRKKTSLKNVLGQEIYYHKSKNRLNAGYGMAAQSPLRRQWLYENHEWKLDESETDEALFNSGNQSATLPYQIGVWTTAHARLHLHRALWIVGDDAVYWDTDSVKYIDNPDNPYDFTALNGWLTNRSLSTGAHAVDKNGETHYMGVYESEKTYSRFCTLGAKKYAYEYADSPDECFCTISGVVKNKGSQENIGGRELAAAGGLERFAACYDARHHFTFITAGGTASFYNDLNTPIHINIEGHPLDVTANVAISPSTYTLGLGKDYQRFLYENKY